MNCIYVHNQMKSGQELPADKQRVVIAGGGVGGLVLAAALQRLNIPVTVIERHANEEREVGADLALWPGAAAILQALEVGADVSTPTTAVTTAGTLLSYVCTVLLWTDRKYATASTDRLICTAVSGHLVCSCMKLLASYAVYQRPYISACFNCTHELNQTLLLLHCACFDRYHLQTAAQTTAALTTVVVVVTVVFGATICIQ
jgi:Pyridine nucleotide-disulphide oxidoreductase